MNAITCAEMFYSIPNEQQASDLRKPIRANKKSAFDFVGHVDSKAEVKADLTFHGNHLLELKYFHFAQFMLIAHRAAHQPLKSEK